MKLILLGAPGAGKGTQAEKICARLGIPTISTGNMIREAMKNGTEMGKKAKEYVEAGGLVPDEVVIGIVKERLSAADCANGFILDGFPRTIPQAEALDAMGVGIDCALSIEVPDEAIIERMSGRRVCACGASYHLAHRKPKVDGVCDVCGGALTLRKDDAPETVKERLHIYHEQTEPLKVYYEKSGKLKTVQGQDKVEDTTACVFAALGL